MLSAESHTIVVANIALFLQLAGLLFALRIDPYIGKRHKRLILFSVFLVASIVIVEQANDMFRESGMVLARTAASVYQYTARPIVIILFMQIIKSDWKPWILALGNAAVFLTAFFSGIAFTITPNNVFVRGPLGLSCHVVSLLLLAWYLCIALQKYKSDRQTENLLPVATLVCVFAGTLVDTIWTKRSKIDLSTAAAVSACVFNYIWLHLQFVREHEADLKAQQRVRTMISQIQPHFIYNSLTAIRSYLDEPRKAEEVLDHFALFLRGSIDMLDCADCISVERELETVNNYLYMEKERFGDKLAVITDLADTGFLLPPFSVQVLVENAVRHGIRGAAGGRGTLTIRTYREKDAHIIEVRDDGKGFDTAILEQVQSGAEMEGHIGLKNLRERLALMCGGTLEIESEPGKGTLARVRIPYSGEETVKEGGTE
ncbi:MAG: hypothetical protein E7425_07120 [Ruminococcaceae bacterium]|nr:hypothetical protein [Oscillospiraceae bacterium]